MKFSKIEGTKLYQIECGYNFSSEIPSLTFQVLLRLTINPKSKLLEAVKDFVNE
jgi:hypothetical protein